MAKSTGKLKKTAVFISGTGSNLKNLIKFSFTRKSPIKISLVISNSKNAIGIKYAKKHRIKVKIFKFNKTKSDDNKILSYLKKNKIKLICLAGFMKILSKNFISYFKGKIINIHPSLLPKYKGLHTHARAIKNKDLYAGCTVHYVTSKLDSGKIIMQKKIKILKKDNEITLTRKVLKLEHKIYPYSIIKVCD